jgi:hypothetical protein
MILTFKLTHLVALNHFAVLATVAAIRFLGDPTPVTQLKYGCG